MTEYIQHFFHAGQTSAFFRPYKIKCDRNIFLQRESYDAILFLESFFQKKAAPLPAADQFQKCIDLAAPVDNLKFIPVGLVFFRQTDLI